MTRDENQTKYENNAVKTRLVRLSGVIPKLTIMVGSMLPITAYGEDLVRIWIAHGDARIENILIYV